MARKAIRLTRNGNLKRTHKKPFKNDPKRSSLIFDVLQLMKGKKPRDISNITKQNGQRGVCYETVRKFYLKPDEGGVHWPSSRTLESIIYSLGGQIKIVRPDKGE